MKVEEKLGFDKVRAAISDRCSTDYAAARVAAEEFSSDPAEIRRRLLLTDEMRLILMFEERFPTSGYIDALPFLKGLEAEGSCINVLNMGKLKTLTDTARRILQGEQVYVICPLVEESEKQALLDVHTLYEELQKIYGGTFRIGMVHGRMSGEEKQQGLEDFAAGKIQLLIATTVVEVGVDVPTATVMIVEHAERFGLSQLHQLRGRVGRGKQQSYCILLGEPAGDTAYQRLLAMQQTNDGFALANLDLKLRGPGDFWGFRQHGLNDLKVLDLTQDQDIIACGEKILPEVEAALDRQLLRDYLALKFPRLDEIASN